MKRLGSDWAALGVVLAACTAGVLAAASLGDYGTDAGPAIDALLGGHVGRFFALQPLMGGFAVLARLPLVFAARAAGAGELGVYRAGVLACLLAAAGLALLLARRTETPARALPLGALAIASPASVAAVQAGHPEEILAGALAVTAVLLAPRRALLAGLTLGLALATKQWALLALPPALLAAPRRDRLRLVGGALGLAALVTLPLVAGSFGAFARTTHQAASAGTISARATIWFLAAHPVHLSTHLGAGFAGSVTVYRLPALVGSLSHPLILVCAPVLGLVSWRRRGNPLALLALLLLARCVLDPVDNAYYHVPFLLALLAYETDARRLVRGLPVLTLAAAAGLALVFDGLDAHAAAPGLTNAVYLATMLPLAAVLLRPACGGAAPARARVRQRRPKSAVTSSTV